ncbi:DUF115 domain-containing protein [Anaerobacillus alkaliphilus]|uniref:DUF115 domain-containing protein n=1 Tax=Anaerobacillus alkaliphilus TaxID=1548597 RepID=A0A4Q0VVX5_9BACI|nr:6-hydroxymethylpterin diphosphokinase MptE-like protein [Anaerobacillus alkaliphilus]RXJ02280.1 DUF115 domain-containing protein [Anaerobacillus alkaliphilus]
MLDVNLEAMTKYYPDLKVRITKHLANVNDFTRVQSKFGGYTLQNKSGLFVHSSYNPQREAGSFVESFSLNNEDTILIFGLGLGYYLPILRQKFQDKKLIVIEPSLEIFNEALQVQDFTEYLKDELIVFLVDLPPYIVGTIVDSFINENKIKSLYIKQLSFHNRMFAEYIRDVKDNLSKQILSKRGNIGTEIVFSQTWLYNTIKNLKYLGTNPSVGHLKNIFSGKPVIIVSAGPSLEKNVHLLKGAYNKSLIIAVGSSINILEKNGVIPHFIVGVDGSAPEARIFEKVKSTKPIFIYSNIVHHRALDVYKGKQFWMNIACEYPFYNKFYSDVPVFRAGPSVANITLDLVYWLNPSAVILVGQDLAYTGNYRYAKGNIHGDDPEMMAELEVEDTNEFIVVKDIHGDEIYTKSDLLLMKNWFEDYVGFFNKDEGIYNCTEGGTPIKGIPNISLNYALQKYCTREYNMDDLLKKGYNISSDINLEKFNQFILDTTTDLNICKKLSKKRIDKTYKLFNAKDKKNFSRKYREIELLTEELESNNSYKELIIHTGNQYITTITTGVHNKINTIEDIQEKRNVLLEGLIKQYLYIHKSIETADAALREVD